MKNPNHILGHSDAALIAAKLGHNMRRYQPVFINRGISGDRVTGPVRPLE